MKDKSARYLGILEHIGFMTVVFLVLYGITRLVDQSLSNGF